MPETPTITPGQVAHDAYNLAFLARHPGPWIWPWAALNPDVQACWEAAAEAVRAMQKEERSCGM